MKKHMDDERFRTTAMKLVREYAEKHTDNSDGEISFDVYCVWYCYILGNIKGLFSTTLPDGMYYEVTYDKEKSKFYFDAYKKFDHSEYTEAPVFISEGDKIPVQQTCNPIPIMTAVYGCPAALPGVTEITTEYRELFDSQRAYDPEVD